MTTIPNDRLWQHIIDLATAFNVELMAAPTAEASAAGYVTADKPLPLAQRRRLICIVPVTDETSYAIALHELGHALSPMGMILDKGSNELDSASDIRLRLAEEEAAWEWAQHYALDWTCAMEQVKAIGLKSYQDMATRYLGRGWDRTGPRKLSIKRVHGQVFVVLEGDAAPLAFVRQTPARVVVQSGTLTATEYTAVCNALRKEKRS